MCNMDVFKLKIDKLENELKELKDKLSLEQSLKKSEILMNDDLKKSNERKELIIQHLAELNDQLIEKVIVLKLRLKKIIDDKNH
jgi:hypothetical protein